MPTPSTKELEAMLDSMGLDTIISGQLSMLNLDAETVDTLEMIGGISAEKGDQSIGLTGDELVVLTMELDKLDGSMDGLVDGIPAFAVLGDIITRGRLTGGMIHDYLIANHGLETVNQAFRKAAVTMASMQAMAEGDIKATSLNDITDAKCLALLLCLMIGEEGVAQSPQSVIRDLLSR
jgi:hypothetical protein